MKLYSKREMTASERIFNYRLSRARRIVRVLFLSLDCYFLLFCFRHLGNGGNVRAFFVRDNRRFFCFIWYGASISFLGVAWEREDGRGVDGYRHGMFLSKHGVKRKPCGFHPKLDSSWTELEFTWEKTSPRSRWIWNTSCFQMNLNLYCLDFDFWESILGDNLYEYIRYFFVLILIQNTIDVYWGNILCDAVLL